MYRRTPQKLRGARKHCSHVWTERQGNGTSFHWVKLVSSVSLKSNSPCVQKWIVERVNVGVGPGFKSELWRKEHLLVETTQQGVLAQRRSL